MHLLRICKTLSLNSRDVQIAGIGSIIPIIAIAFSIRGHMKLVALKHRDVEQMQTILIKKGFLLIDKYASENVLFT